MRAASVLLVLALLTACASTTPSPAPGSSTKPGLEGIAAAYLDLVATSNAATCRFNATLSQPAPALEELKLASADYAGTLTTLIGGLQAIPWPAEGKISQHTAELTSALAAALARASAMAEADSMSAFIAADNELIAANGLSADAAAKVRDDLGLPSGKNPCT